MNSISMKHVVVPFTSIDISPMPQVFHIPFHMLHRANAVCQKIGSAISLEMRALLRVSSTYHNIVIPYIIGY